MEVLGNLSVNLIEMGGLFAPLLFIFFHLLRPIFFLPVIFICITGGFLFGPIAGSLYSWIGITLSSILFYGVYQKIPIMSRRIFSLKNRILGETVTLTNMQIGLLRLVPFIHFHLLSLYLIEISSSFREYTKVSILSNMPLAFIYTSIGGIIQRFTPLTTTILLLLLFILFYTLRKKESVMKWHDFFTAPSQAKHSSS